MRKLLIPLLLAGAAATPALADRHDHGDREQARAERSQAREESHGDRGVQVERPHFEGGAQQVERPHFNGGQQFSPSNGGGQQPFVFRQRMQQDNDGGEHRQVEPLRVVNHDAPDSVRNWRGARRDRVVEGDPQVMPDRHDRFDNDGGALRRGDRPLPHVMQPRIPVVSDVPREGTQPPLRVDSHRRGDVRWSTDWRRDNRYDWRDWRKRHRSWFSLGIYYDPFGWGYQPYSIGWRMWPSYYGSRYWINDPWQYRLPYAPPGYRWIRYWDDAVLVDEWTGEVEDVIYNFFW